MTLRGAVSDCCDVLEKLGGRSLNEAADGFLTTVANVQRKDIKQAAEEFIAAEEPRTKASAGQRAQLSPMHLGFAKDDYAQQADAITFFAGLAMELNVHIHVVAPQNKSESKRDQGGKRSVAGAFEIIANATTSWQ